MIEKLGLASVVEHWWRTQRESLPEGRAVNVKELWHWLVEEHQYGGSYKSVWKHVRAQFPTPKLRPFRRLETPPGAQAQSDWLEAKIDIGDGGRTTVYGFLMTPSHSRYSAVVWSRSMDQLAWHRVHNEALKRLGGVAAVNRIDNLKTGVSRGAGPWGEINACYRSYAHHGFSRGPARGAPAATKRKSRAPSRRLQTIGFDAEVCFVGSAAALYRCAAGA